MSDQIEQDIRRILLQVESMKSEVEQLYRQVNGGVADRGKGGLVGTLITTEQRLNVIDQEQARLNRLLLGEHGDNGLRDMVLANGRRIDSMIKDLVWVRPMAWAIVALVIITSLINIAVMLSVLR